jgi:hypothetical protein
MLVSISENFDQQRKGYPMQISSTPVRVETWPIDRLIPYARNPRKNDQAVDRMCASIREFGFKIPCLVRSDGEVVDGQSTAEAVEENVAAPPGGQREEEIRGAE